MNREQLRKACKEAGIKYGKMTTQEMRDALNNIANNEVENVVVNTEVDNAEVVNTDNTEVVNTEVDDEVLADEDGCELEIIGEVDEDGCEPEIVDGFLYDDGCEDEIFDVIDEENVEETKNEEIKDLKPRTEKKAKVARVEQNGIKRPLKPGKCLAVWEFVESHTLSEMQSLKPIEIHKFASRHGYNLNNCLIEFYNCLRFHGIERQKAKKEKM